LSVGRPVTEIYPKISHENKVKGKNAEQTKAEGKRPESRDAEQKDIAVHPDL